MIVYLKPLINNILDEKYHSPNKFMVTSGRLRVNPLPDMPILGSSKKKKKKRYDVKNSKPTYYEKGYSMKEKNVSH